MDEIPGPESTFWQENNLAAAVAILSLKFDRANRRNHSLLFSSWGEKNPRLAEINELNHSLTRIPKIIPVKAWPIYKQEVYALRGQLRHDAYCAFYAAELAATTDK